VPENGWAGVIGDNVSMMGVVAGMLTLLMSLVGCAAANSQSRPALCCYLCVFITVWAIQIAAAAGMVNYGNQLQMTGTPVPSGALTSYSDVQIQNAAFSLYQRCCTGCPNLACNNPSPDSYVNYTLPYCSPPNSCVFVVPCQNTSQNRCFNFFSSGATVVVPPYPVDGSLCSSIASLSTVNALGQLVSLVGNASQGGCGGGDPAVFLTNLDLYVSSSLNGVAVVFVLVVLFESLVLPAGLYLAVTGGSRYRKGAVGDDADGGLAAGAGAGGRDNVDII